jgi:hypothetical protein
MFDLISTITAAREMHEAAVTLRAVATTGSDASEARVKLDEAFERLCAALGYRIRTTIASLGTSQQH